MRTQPAPHVWIHVCSPHALAECASCSACWCSCCARRATRRCARPLHVSSTSRSSAASLSRSRVIGLLATPGTVRRQYTAQLINDFASDCCVISVGSSALAPAIERQFWEGTDHPELYQTLAAEFAGHPRAPDMDTLVLACTHFPLVAAQLREYFPGVSLVDSGEAIARRVESLLGPALPTGDQPGEQRVIVLGERRVSAHFLKKLSAQGISQRPTLVAAD